ncbi:GNAT family N-acetyltransferase [Cellulomonas sp. NPDC089187]|uniref:GNAT family N-acetyltransferase n=1 Tax=Cellulomonas sp. NPDC089187 TaxID=3154970 RepID=UPI0034383513
MSQQRAEHLIRPAVVADAEGIAGVHIRSWQSAYRGMLPDSYLDGLDLAERGRWWRNLLEHPDWATTWVAVQEDAIVGFLSLGPSRDEDADTRTLEIYTVYLEPALFGSGIARDLMRTALAEVPARSTVTLWTAAENERGRHFYRRHGFSPDGTERIEQIGGTDLSEVRYRRG